MPDIPLDLFQQIAERANDPLRRTYMAGAHASARPLNVDAIITDQQEHSAPEAQGLAGAVGHLHSLMGRLDSSIMMGPDGPVTFGASQPVTSQPLRPPPNDTTIKEAETAIGRTFPPELHQLYTIADGGFGPGDGLFPISELIGRYGELLREPFGPNGQAWPAHLLPLFDANPILICFNLDSSAVVAWDPEEIEDENSDADWQRSFKPEQTSLSTLMEAWLNAPTFQEEYTAGSPSQRQPQFVSGEDPVDNAIRLCASMSPAERKNLGLPDVGWEDELRRRHGH